MPKVVLIVDDEEDVRESVRMILNANGFKAETAVDAYDCIKKVEHVKPDLILLDIMMPGKPVSEIIKELSDTKIAFMSVVRISDARKRGLCSQPNIVDFFQKPFNVSDLVDRVEFILNG